MIKTLTDEEIEKGRRLGYITPAIGAHICRKHKGMVSFTTPIRPDEEPYCYLCTKERNGEKYDKTSFWFGSLW